MRHENGVKSLFVVALLTFTFSLSTITAQTSVKASNGNAMGSGGSTSYCVGQVICTTNIGTSGSLEQSIHQPFEISVITGLEEAKGINLSVSAYPKPTTDYLTLEVKDFALSTLTFQLNDMQGNLLQNSKITGNQTSMLRSNYCLQLILLKKQRSKNI
jgi:hypothetical protein